MCKNVILNTAIDAALDLPRKALWTATSVAVIFSLEAGLSIIGDTVEMKPLGTTQVQAASGLLTNKNVANSALVDASFAGISINAWVSASGTVGAVNPNNGGTTVGGPGTLGEGGNVIYASELFRGTAPDSLPGGVDGSNNFQAICYQLGGAINDGFSVEFKMTGGQFYSTTSATIPPNFPYAFGVGAGTDVNGVALGAPASAKCDFTATVSAASAKLNIASAASCTLGDGAQVCLIYKIAGSSVSALKTPGQTVSIAAEVKTVKAAFVNQAAAIVVAESKQGANFSLLPEADGQVFISASSGNKEFISSEGAGAINADDNNAFMSSNQVKIGYIMFSPGEVVGADGTSAFGVGDDPADAATLVVTDGQFSASPGGSSAGKVFLGQVTDAVATVDVAVSPLTATWNLTNTQLQSIVANSPIPIIIKVDGLTAIDSGTDTDPVGTLTVTMGTAKTPISDQPITSALRRIPYDGKVCTAYNIPSPTGAADILTLRITNDSDQVGTITGTLYNEAGEELGAAVDLLAGHIDYTKNPPIDRATLGLADPLQLQARETVILTSQNIATAFGQTEWPGERWVLKINSTIPRIEVFNLLRNTENVSLQPLSNVSTSAKGVECSPIP